MPPKRPLSPPSSSLPPTTTTTPTIYRSSPLSDRSSRFQALYSPSLPASHLQRLPELATATHRIAAWRVPTTFPSSTQGPRRGFETGHDDDGETNGGRHLSSVLVPLNVTGAVVVARWYGGRMLGP
ncbi:hypothetical protein Q9189_006127, partial [Teloschistes chrysophthalmus]